MINRPDSIAWIAGIFILAIVTIGMGVGNLIDQGAQGGNQSVFFTDVEGRATSSNGVFGAGVDSADALGADEGTDEETTEEGILTAGFQNLLNLGKVYNEAKTSLNEGSQYIGIPPVYVLVLTAMLIISLSVVIYTWIRGR